MSRRTLGPSHGRRGVGSALVILAIGVVLAAIPWAPPPAATANGSGDGLTAAGDRPDEVAAAAATIVPEPVPALPVQDGPAWRLRPDDEDDPGALVAAAYPGIPAPGRVARHHVPVLTYHVIAPRATARAYSIADLDVSPALFEAHLRALRDGGWRTITAEGLAQALASDRVPPARTLVITIDDGFADGFAYALPLLRRSGFIATFYVVAGRVGDPNHLTWDEIRSLAATGMEIGNHTQDHLALTGQPAPEVSRQVVEAQHAIERETGVLPTTLAYPFGDVNAGVAAAVEAAGLSLAFTTRGGSTETWASRFLLPRIHVGSTLSAASLMAVLETDR